MAEFWKPTAEMFTNLIEKPKMTEKLLSKPPFKYIFDIVIETTKKTQFGNGLYKGEELNGDYYNDKDKKIAFLKKIIRLVELMSGVQLKAKPEKIVAGLQPQVPIGLTKHTNVFLQGVHKCATSGKPSGPFVNKVLGIPQEQKKEQKKQQVQQKKEVIEKADSKDDKKKPERPPSARIIKKNVDPPSKTNVPSKQVVEEPKEEHIEEKKEEKPIQKKQGPNQQQPQYSKQVKDLMEQGEEEVQAQKETQIKEQENKKQLKMGNLGNRKKPKQQKEKITSAGDLSDKQLQLVKGMIQSICQNTAPLGKSIEFINDDIQSMNKELMSWRKQYNSSKVKYQSELKITEEALMPVYDKLAEIEDQIKDQKAKIQALKSQILKNDTTTRDLLLSIITTK